MKALYVLAFVAYSVGLVAIGVAWSEARAARNAVAMHALGITPAAPRPAVRMTDCKEALRVCAARRRMTPIGEIAK